jgi:hypothetical protein
MTHTTWWAAMVRSTPRSTSSAPKALRTPTARNTGAAILTPPSRRGGENGPVP